MIRSTSRRRLVAIVVGATALATAGLLAGCGSGQVAETADIVAAVPGTNYDLKVNGGVISLRDATIDYPGPNGYLAGEDAPLSLRIVNGTTSPIALTGATASAVPGGGELGKVEQVGGAPSVAPSVSAPPPTSNPTPSGKGRGSASASPSESASASPSPSGLGGSSTINVPVPGAPDGLIILSRADSGGTYLVISGLTQQLLPGQAVHLILTFTLADGTSVQMGASTVPGQQLAVPVAVPLSPAPRAPLSLSPAGG